ncbi:MAG TPA: GDSL-type esterase/lipase family protein [Polyangiaceae bacterium]
MKPRLRAALATLAGTLLTAACDPGAHRDRPAATASDRAPSPPPPTASPTPVLPASTAAPPFLTAPAASASPDPDPASPPAPPSPAASAPTPASPKSPCHVALIGDSLTDFRSAGGGFVRYLEARAPKSRFSNFAKGGAMVNQMRRHFETSVLAEPPGTFTHLVLFGGVNDLYSDETAGRTPAKIEKDLTAMYRAAKERGLRVVAIDVAPWGGFAKYDNPKRRAATLELNTWILEQEKTGAVDIAVDAYRLLSCGDPARLCPRYEPPHKDGLHFGKAGHEVLGEALYAAEFRRCS